MTIKSRRCRNPGYPVTNPFWAEAVNGARNLPSSGEVKFPRVAGLAISR